MASTITFRLDRETDRILRALAPKGKRERSRVIREALKTRWELSGRESSLSSREIYASLGIKPGKPTRDRARNVERLLKEKLFAKRRQGTL
ncbi:MAG TPA: ribbon-helix-helix protein, CopG family [Terriglobia bacterium]|nr:ribbon-helix-helix protein, CopG family [Terriglobia bacterium]